MCLVTYWVQSVEVGGIGVVVRVLLSVLLELFCLGWQDDSCWRTGYDVSYYIPVIYVYLS